MWMIQPLVGLRSKKTNKLVGNLLEKKDYAC